MDKDSDPIKQFFPDEEDVDLYAVLGLTNEAAPDDVKKAYRRLALSFHPDKQAASTAATTSPEERAKVTLKFQQVGYAYTILSDAGRRARYDATGRTDESFLEGVADSEGGWEGYFEAIFEKVSRQRLDEDKKRYQGSDEEIADIKEAYLEYSGSIESILSHIPHSTYADESRISSIISSLIKSKDLDSLPEWEKGLKDTKGRKEREKRGKKEEAEAEAAAKELGVWDEFYGTGKTGERKGKTKASGKGKKDEGEAEVDESALQALILKRAEKRQADSSSFLDRLAAKYGGADGNDDNDDEEEEEPKSKSKAKPKAKPKAKSKASTSSAPTPKKGKKRTAPAASDEEDDAEDSTPPSPKKKARTTKKADPQEMDDAEFSALQAKMFGKKSVDQETKEAGASSGSGTRKSKSATAAASKRSKR